MDAASILIALGVAAWLGIMAIAIALPIRPDVVKIVRWLVIPREAEMQVETYVYPYHRPGERAIGIYCRYADGKKKSVKVRALFALWGIFFVAALPIAFIVVRIASGGLR